MTSHGQCPRGGACECPRVGAFFKLMTSRGQCPRGGGACECPRVGAFFKLMTSRGQCPREGGAPGVPPIQVQTPPHLAGWLRAWVCVYVCTYRCVCMYVMDGLVGDFVRMHMHNICLSMYTMYTGMHVGM